MYKIPVFLHAKNGQIFRGPPNPATASNFWGSPKPHNRVELVGRQRSNLGKKLARRLHVVGRASRGGQANASGSDDEEIKIPPTEVVEEVAEELELHFVHVGGHNVNERQSARQRRPRRSKI